MEKRNITLLDKKNEINQINEKLITLGVKELLIVHTTITALYNRQQFDDYDQSLYQAPRELEIVGK